MGLEVVFAAIAIGSTAGSIYSSSKAASATKKASQAQRRQEALAAAVNRRRELKSYRQAAALALQAGENQGVATSSGVQGGLGSLQSQSTANLSFLDQQSQLADFAGRMFDRAAKWNQTTTTLNGIGQLAMQGYSMKMQANADELAKKQYEKMFSNG